MPDYTIITARYKGACCVCGSDIKPGDQIKYKKGDPVLHAGCEMPEIPPNAIVVSGGSGYGYEGWYPGQVIVNHAPKEGEPEFLFVLIASSRYFDEDGMSFGVGDEQGHVYYATCRTASEEESAPLRAQIQDLRQKKDMENRRKLLSQRIRETGIFPDKADPEGTRITDRQNLYGGGDWFVMGEDRIWYVLNNGHDGDDWSCNNVGTGGAGALGWYLPRSADLESELLEIEAVLDPGQARKRAALHAGSLGSTAFRKHFAAHLDARLWGVDSGAPQTVPRVPFVTLAAAETKEVTIPTVPPTQRLAVKRPAILLGLGGDGNLWLAQNFSDAYDDYDVYSFLGGNYAFALRCEQTPERLAEFERLLPDWCPIELIQAGFDADKAASLAVEFYQEWLAENPEPEYRHDFTDDEKRLWMDRRQRRQQESHAQYLARQSAEAEAREAVWCKVQLSNGRYRLPPGSASSTWASSSRNALRQCIIWGISLSEVTLEPGVELLYNNGESRYTGRPFQLWSDGHATTGECEGDGSTQLGKDVANLLAAALRQKYWHGGRWKKLLDVESLDGVQVLNSTKEGGPSGGEARELERITLRLKDGQQYVLYRLIVNWWVMGADGDAGDDLYLYEGEQEARAAFHERA